MKTSDEMRLANLVELVKKYGGVTNLTRALGRSTRDNTLNQLLNKSPSSTTGMQKHMGNKLAREIEEALGLERGHMDNDHEIAKQSLEPLTETLQRYEMLSIEQKGVIKATMIQLIEAMIGAPSKEKEKSRNAA
ncbi:hypothetical protein [Polynucleobacter sp. Fuers-14]|uniref:hypothetical protein n=1 Tax=Polynucleobacter sp. Fuers-14 TaxID=1758364 RepID=UPI001C0C33E2|nr:hypothetical protein [Polynucleobacter sp. Fuers-14]MBU3640960.1 hypothetical protein [Polynucleobacter sp. Fuers-14]